MAYTDLSTEQKTQLQEWLQLVRPIQGEFAKVMNHMVAAKVAYTSHISDVLALLADVDEVPNQSGLAGAIDVTKAELTTILGLLNAALAADTDENRVLWTKFCGAANLIG